MAKTRTGNFPIGFRRGWGDWQRDLGGVVRWARENDFEHMDFGPISVEDARRVADAGLTIGSADLPDWPALASPDPVKRRERADAAAAYVRSLVPLGVRVFFAVVAPEDPGRSRRENFEFAADGYGRLCEAVGSAGATVVLEGAPGKPPYFASLACTPADCRAFLKAVGSDALGINFDPSHLIRLGIDPVRFLREFGPRVGHVHAKDTELLPDGLYEHGNLQPPTFAVPGRYAGPHWRYALPGRGAAPWGALFSVLEEAGFAGRVSIELEDEQYIGTEGGEKRGLTESREFLRSV